MLLEDICDIYSGYAIKEFNEDKLGIPVIKISNILKDGTIELDDCQYTIEKIDHKYQSKYDDIYIALSGATTGKIGILKSYDKFIINQRVGIIRKKENTIPIEFIKYFLFYYTDRILKEASGCAQPNISPKQIGKYILPRVGGNNIKFIVEILESLTNIIKKRKEQLNHLDELIKARFVEMFVDTNDKYEKWPLSNSVEEMFIGPFGSSLKNEMFVDKEEAFCMVYEQKHAIQKTLDLPARYVDRKKFNELKRFTVMGGDIIVSCRGTIGEIYSLPENSPIGIMHPSIMKIRLKPEKYCNAFFELMLSEFMKDNIEKNNGSGIKMAITAKDLGKEAFILPPLKKQMQFEEFVSHVNKSKVKVQKALDEAQLLFDSLMQKYFG
nr:restriction endonuclease subunit S [uncultured Lachnoanaerobaculum sp.]